MTTDPRCLEVRLSLPELALGTLGGQERARVLEHVETCAECRRELQTLVEVGDELLLLAPSAEPPVGFESRVLERLPAGASIRPRWRRLAVAAAVVVIAASVGGTGIYLLEGADRRLAAGYREALAVADGRYVAARPFLGSDGRTVGYVFGYQGSPSWIFCLVRTADDGNYEIEVTADGDTWIAGDMQVRDRAGTWHQLLDVDLHALEKIRLIERSTGSSFVARW